MPAMPTLKVTQRDSKDNLEALRKEGFVPAVFYGKEQDAMPISVSTSDFMKVWKEVGETSTIKLQAPSGDVNAMVYEVQTDPIKGDLVHIDFYVVKKGQKVEVEVPLVFEGEAPVEKQNGVVIKVLHELTVEGEPQNIPQEFTIDLTGLTDFDSQILVKDVPIPAGLELISEPDEVIVAVSEAKEEEEEPAEDIDMSAIEVEEKGKKEEEDSDSDSASEEEKS